MKFTENKGLGSFSRYLSPVLISIIMLALIGFFVYYVIPFFKRMKETQDVKNEVKTIENHAVKSEAENSQNNVEIQKKKASAIKKKYPKISTSLMNNLKTYAQNIAASFGTDVENYRPLFGVSGLPKVHNQFTEDEDQVVSILKKTIGTFDVVAELYQNVYTLNRNLKSDIYKYLSKSDIEEIRKAHRKFTSQKII
jgi:predicted S18 family serine protease